MKISCFISLLGVSGSYARGVFQTIKTSSGPVRGHAATHESGVSAFLGIPYALPPVGNRRFMPPEKYHGDEVINADSIVSLSHILTHLGFHSASTSGIRLSSKHTVWCRCSWFHRLRWTSCQLDCPRIRNSFGLIPAYRYLQRGLPNFERLGAYWWWSKKARHDLHLWRWFHLWEHPE